MRGFAAWLASKLSVLLFATAVFSMLAYYYSFVQDFQKKDEFGKTADNIARFVETVGSAGFPISSEMSVEGINSISASRTVNGAVLTITSTQPGLVATKEVITPVIGSVSAPSKLNASFDGSQVRLSQ